MLSDVGALGLSLLALNWTARPPTDRKTYGYHRLEILVALVNGLVLWAIAGLYFLRGGRPTFSAARHQQPAPDRSSPVWVCW